MTNKEIEERKGIAGLILIFSACVFVFNSMTGVLLAWIGNYDWRSATFPSVEPKLMFGVWIVQGISWLTAAAMIGSWLYIKHLDKKEKK